MILTSLMFSLFAALLHVYIFTMESITWTKPATWKRFTIASQANAEITRPLAYNQGFYNLFLAIVSLSGIIAIALGSHLIGWALVFSSCGSMLLAALVLAASGKKYLRAASIQGVTPLIAVVFGVMAVMLG